MERLAFLRELNMASVCIRLCLAVLCGGFIGLERERKRRPAGFRTYILVSLGAALTMLLSQYIYEMSETFWKAVIQEIGIQMDVSRFGAQVINGVGFLGAGTIILTNHHEIRGLTTAAGLWASACMGLAVGAGFYECVLLGFFLILLSVILLPMIEQVIQTNTLNMNLYVKFRRAEDAGEVIRCLKEHTEAIYEVNVEQQASQDNNGVSMSFYIRLRDRQERLKLLSALMGMEGVRLVEEL